MSTRLNCISRHIVPSPVSGSPGDSKKVALVFGVGPRGGLGGAIAHRFAREGYHVFIVGRTLEKMEETKKIIEADGRCKVSCIALKCIAQSNPLMPADTDGALMEKEVIAAFDEACAAGTLEVVVQNQGPNMLPPTGVDMRDMETAFLRYMWENNVGISFLVGREAARRMVKDVQTGKTIAPCGTLIFTGATGSLRGKPPFVAFAQAKAGVRFLAQSLAREFGPKGLHVGHVVIEGAVAGDRIQKDFGKKLKENSGIDIDATAETMWHLHRQPPSTWTHELEVRPFAGAW